MSGYVACNGVSIKISNLQDEKTARFLLSNLALQCAYVVGTLTREPCRSVFVSRCPNKGNCSNTHYPEDKRGNSLIVQDVVFDCGTFDKYDLNQYKSEIARYSELYNTLCAKRTYRQENLNVQEYDHALPQDVLDTRVVYTPKHVFQYDAGKKIMMLVRVDGGDVIDRNGKVLQKFKLGTTLCRGDPKYEETAQSKSPTYVFKECQNIICPFAHSRDICPKFELCPNPSSCGCRHPLKKFTVSEDTHSGSSSDNWRRKE